MNPILKDIRESVANMALKRCIESIRSELEDPQCKPWLIIGIRAETKCSDRKMEYVQHLYPVLCDTAGIAEPVLSGYEYGYALEVETLRKKFNIKVKEL